MNHNDQNHNWQMSLHFAKFIVNLANKKTPSLYIASALVSHCTQTGHVCLELARFAGKSEPWLNGAIGPCPELDSWRRDLRNSGVVGQPGDFKPLILDRDRQTYWQPPITPAEISN